MVQIFTLNDYFFGNWTYVQRYISVDSARSAKKVALLFCGPVYCERCDLDAASYDLLSD